MRRGISPWIVIMALLLLLMIASFLGIVPISPVNVFWIVVTVACIWAIYRIFFSGKKRKV